MELVVWQRQLPLPLAHWLDTLPAAQLPSAQQPVAIADLDQGILESMFNAASTPAGPMRDALMTDIAFIMRHFAHIIGHNELVMRLEAIDNNACRRLHRDCVPLRLLTTYRGPGTDWIASEFAEQALTAPDTYEGPIERMATHDVAIFKGCGFPGQPHDGGIVHRSPPILGTGTTRLVLCLNFPIF